ncbi:MAG: hypothetical protein EOP54_13085, partial [Sphingobacteriales bacterium]
MVRFLPILIMLFVTSAFGQSPGGVATDLSVWYKGDNGVTTNGSKLVTQWASSSATSVILTPNAAAILPYNDQTTYSSTFNFNPTVTFDGTNNFLRNTTTAYLTSAGSVHYIVVAKGANRSTATRNLFSISGNDDGFFYSGVGGNTAFPTVGNNFNIAAAAITSVEDFGIYSAILPKTAVQGTQRGFYNGLKKNYPAPYPYTGGIYALPTTGAYMGADGTTTDNFNGDIAEVILYHNTGGGDLTDANLEKIHSYLAVKYGITLTSTQSYLTSANQVVWNAASNTGFTNNIFGLGRDNASGLHQKQSKSTNTNQKLVFGNASALFSTNAANTNSLSDGQFLLIGDNGLKQSLTTPLTYAAGANGAANYRFGSIWKVQNTGTVGSVTVAWPKGVANLYLVQSTDAAFDATDTFTSMATEVTINGVVYNTTNVTLGNGQFFTFAGYEFAPGGVTTAAWYRADGAANLFSDAGTTAAADNATIQQWNEFNNKPFSLSQSTANLKPQFSNATTLVNFNPTVNYTTSSKWLQYDGNALGNIIDRSTGALFSAGNTTGTTAFFGFGTSGAGNTMDDPGLYNFTGNKFLFYPITFEYVPVSTYSINGPYIGGGTWQNGAGVGGNNAVDITLNGYHQTYNTGINNVTMAAGRNALMAGGAETSVAFQQNEMIVFPNKLTDQETNKVESYLAIKYGQTLSKEQNRNYLSSTGAVVWEGTTNNNYYNNIFGIARDNISALHQKQSKSVNANQKLLLGVGNTLANTNTANTNNLTEGQYLIVGDNGLQQSFTTALLNATAPGGATNTRLASIWKVENTGTVGQVTVAWPKSIPSIHLVQSSDEVFDNTDTFTAMATEVTVNGVVYNTATVTLGNGTFFTFAGLSPAPGGVAGPDFWVRSDDAGTIATAWKDQSLNADNIPNEGVTLAAADRAHNFHPFTTGYSASKFFYNPASLMNPLGNVELANTNTSIFSAVRPTTNGTGRITGIDDDTNAAEPGISIAAGEPRQYEFFNTATSTDFSTDFNIGQSNIFSAIANNSVANLGTSASAGGEKRLGLNGAYEMTPYTGSNKFQIYGTNLRVGHGGWDAPGPFPGDIMEVVWYKRALTANEQSRVNSYLAVKNGTTLAEDYLSTNSSIVWSTSSNTGYNRNIFGIARDNITALHQKQSTSANVNQQLVIGNNSSLFNANADNTNDLTEGQYLIVGDNGLPQSFTTALLNSSAPAGATNVRLGSIWKVQNTGTVGQVTVAWPKGVPSLHLVQSSDDIFDNTDTFTAMPAEVTVNGVVYNTATVMLGNGTFFTFAGLAPAPGGVVGPDFWVRSDDAGTIATAWKDQSLNADNIPNEGGMTLAAADRAHNFHPYTTGYSGTKFFYNPTSVMNPLGNVELPNTNTSIFSAVRPTTNGTGRITGIDDDITLAAEPGISIATGNPRQYEFFNTVTSTDFSTVFNIGQSNIFSAIANNSVANLGTSASAGGEKILGLNGAYETTPFIGSNKFQIYGTNLRIGQAGWDAGGSFPGDIMEVVWYKRALTANEQSRVNSYLAVKNGTTLAEDYLSTNSSVVWSISSNTGYNSNIFGIARDNITALHQ